MEYNPIIEYLLSKVNLDKKEAEIQSDFLGAIYKTQELLKRWEFKVRDMDSKELFKLLQRFYDEYMNEDK